MGLKIARYCLLAILGIAIFALSGCGSTRPTSTQHHFIASLSGPPAPRSHLWVTHTQSQHLRACGSPDCGEQLVTLNWDVTLPGVTGYFTFVDGTQVADVPTQTYTFFGLHCGHTYLLGVQAHNGTGGTSPLSTLSYTVNNCVAPRNLALPVINGTTNQGQTLTATQGTWARTSVTSYAYQWQDCDSVGNSCVNINGATNTTYGLVANDVGHTLRVQVLAINQYGNTTVTSGQTATVVGPPVNTVTPVISGTTTQGSTLSTTNGTWTNSPTSFTYQWQRCAPSCSNIASATASTYVLQAADVSKTIDVVVTANNAAGSGTATSSQTVVITGPPANTVLPVISGTTTQGSTLSTTNGTWTNSPTSFTYQWQRCAPSCSNIASATTNTYVLQLADVGDTIDVIVTATNASGSTPSTSASTAIVTGTGGGTFPLQVSTNGRYLVTAGGQPYLITADSPQGLIVNAGNVSGNPVTDANTYFTARKAEGFNTVWINLLADTYTGGNVNGTTFDGISPFTTGTDPTNYNDNTPNASYFTRVDSLLTVAQQQGFTVVLDPMETGGWLQTLENNGTGTTSNNYKYGQFLGNRYKTFTNIIWMSGNDYNYFVNDPTFGLPDQYVTALADGIRNTDPAAMQTVEVGWQGNANHAGSLDDAAGWGSRIQFQGSYAYPPNPTYTQTLTDYNRATIMPDVLIEAFYENEHSITQHDLRAQEYWALLAGANGGQFYGEHFTSFFLTGWNTHLNDTNAAEMRNLVNLFSTREWQNLVPDQQAHGAGSLVSANFGTYGQTDYVASALAPDDKLGMAYLPSGGTTTVNLSDFASTGPVTARWYDPTNGAFTAIAGSPFAGSGTHAFTVPGTNSGGDSDWILLLEASGGTGGSVPVNTVAPPAPTGTIQSGSTLTASSGTWSNTPTEYDYTWQDCTGSGTGCSANGTTCIDTGGTLNSGCTYLLGAGDVNKFVNVVVTAKNASGSGTPVTSAAVGPITSGGGGGSSAPIYSPPACNQPAVTPATYVNAVTNAAGGAVICLSAGTYASNTFSALDKTSTVTVEPSPGATVHLGGVVLQGANHVTFMGFSSVNGSSDSGGLTISGQFGDLVRNTTWSFNSMPNDPSHPNGAGVIVNTNPTSNANILIQNNKFIGYGNAGEQDRTLVNAQNDPSCPDGITISFNEFEGPTGTSNTGASDGTDIDGGTCGTQILNNIYHDINEASCGPLPDGGPSSIHCDSIQDNGGGATTTINGNYFFNDTIGLRFDDGSVQDTVTNNVFDIPNVRCVEGEYGSPSQFSHNTFGNCEVNVGQDHNGDRSNNLTMTNNAFGGGSGFTYFPDCTTWGTYAALNFNVQSGAYGCSFANGANDKIGTPTFVGGAEPSTWAGWALTSGSLGHLAASDGKNMGADVSITPGPSW